MNREYLLPNSLPWWSVVIIDRICIWGRSHWSNLLLLLHLVIRKHWIDLKAAHWQLSTHGFGKKTIVTPTPAVFKLTISAPTIYSCLHLWQGSLGYCEDVTEALCCSRYEDTKAFAGNPDAAGAGKSGFWTAGYDPCADRGEHPPPWPAGEPHQGPQRAQTDAVASLKWYRVLFMLSVNTGGQAELGFGF